MPVAETLSEQLLKRTKLPPLHPKAAYDSALISQITSSSLPPLTKAILHLLNDDIMAAHEIAQSMEGESTANMIHAIVHRREGDFWNSKYWWARVRSHPVLKEVWGSRAGAEQFVDRVEGGSNEAELEAEQWKELKALYSFVQQNQL